MPGGYSGEGMGITHGHRHMERGGFLPLLEAVGIGTLWGERTGLLELAKLESGKAFRDRTVDPTEARRRNER